jgi:hypothetical protein
MLAANALLGMANVDVLLLLLLSEHKQRAYQIQDWVVHISCESLCFNCLSCRKQIITKTSTICVRKGVPSRGVTTLIEQAFHLQQPASASFKC